MSGESLIYLLWLSSLSWKPYEIGKIFKSCVKLRKKIEKYFVCFSPSCGISILVRYVSVGLYGITSATGGFASVGLLLRLDRNAGHRVRLLRESLRHTSPLTLLIYAYLTPLPTWLRLPALIKWQIVTKQIYLSLWILFYKFNYVK